VQKLATPLAVEPKTQPIQSSEVTSATTAASETDHRPLPEITKDSTENSRSPIKMPPQTPDYLNNPKPFYPLAAKRRGIKGRVILEVIVSASGAATQVLIKKSSGYKLLDRAASDTVASWRFIPASEDGENIEAIVEIPIRFELTQG
jgi:protein TonB